MNNAFSAIAISEHSTKGVMIKNDVIPRNEQSFFSQGYGFLDCDTIQMLTIQLCGQMINVFFDECGKFKNSDDVLGILITDDQGAQWDIAGNVMMTRDNEEPHACFTKEELREMFEMKRLQAIRVPTAK